MEPTIHAKSPLASPDPFKVYTKRSVKIDYKKNPTMSKCQGQARIFQRRSSEKPKVPVLQPLKMMMFDTDPLSLLTVSQSSGIDSPELVSTPKDQNKSQSNIPIEALNSTDPLNLFPEDDNSITRSARKRKKKRHRTSSIVCGEDEESYNTSELISPTEETPSKQLKYIQDIRSPIVEKNNEKTKVSLKRSKFKYGNFISYNNTNVESSSVDNIKPWQINRDQRLHNFKKEWFSGKKCLSIGCGDGQIVYWITKNCHPLLITGLDIDEGLINIAKNRSREFQDNHITDKVDFPVSIPMSCGPISTGFKITPRNITRNNSTSFIHGDDP
uniref:RNA methyltransferase n=1 Tax=Clytia hemisphaerica TaxID=252671 RepID=A0A7M5V2C9_9CNID